MKSLSVLGWALRKVRSRVALTGLLTLVAMTYALPSQAVIMSHFVDSAASGPPFVIGQYDFASIDVFIDPAVTNWIAWNNAPSLVIANPGCSGGLCLGPGGFGTDDSIRITVTNLNTAQSLGVLMDQNTAFGNSFGPQNVIFGTAAGAPDVIRVRNPFSFPSQQIFNEAGAHNALFTGASTYRFDFSFRNDICCGAGHGDTYLLVDAAAPIPEPSTLTLLGLGLASISVVRLRSLRRTRGKHQGSPAK